MWVLETEKKIVGGREGEGDTHTHTGRDGQLESWRDRDEEKDGQRWGATQSYARAEAERSGWTETQCPGDRGRRKKPWKAK